MNKKYFVREGPGVSALEVIQYHGVAARDVLVVEEGKEPNYPVELEELKPRGDGQVAPKEPKIRSGEPATTAPLGTPIEDDGTPGQEDGDDDEDAG